MSATISRKSSFTFLGPPMNFRGSITQKLPGYGKNGKVRIGYKKRLGFRNPTNKSWEKHNANFGIEKKGKQQNSQQLSDG